MENVTIDEAEEVEETSRTSGTPKTLNQAQIKRIAHRVVASLIAEHLSTDAVKVVFPGPIGRAELDRILAEAYELSNRHEIQGL